MSSTGQRHPRRRRVRVIIPLGLAWMVAGPALAEDGTAFFENRIRPLLSEQCLRCHGADGTSKGGLKMTSREAILAGGDSGPAAVPGDVDKSRLIHAVRYADEKLAMPPKKKLSDQQIADVTTWVRMGLPWPAGAAGRPLATAQHWSLRPLKEPAVPEVAGVANPIDRFIISRLPKGVALAPPPAATSLLRRVTIDLTGLPSTPAEIESFLADRDSAAFDRVVDRLLASEDFGERWARHWLDVARYSDSGGYSTDTDRPTAYHYRDFVIRAFNQDMPYHEFVRLQVAGDRLRPGDGSAVAATGFCTAGAFNNNKPQDKDRLDELDDIVSTTGLAFLGLTMGCCRCHDHKFDPVSQRDYYSLTSVFSSSRRGDVSAPDLSGKPAKMLALSEGPKADLGRWLLSRGDPDQRKEELPPGFIAVLTRAPEGARRWLTAASEDPRRALGDWLVDVEHGAGALVARVMVNRLWQHHFGTGLVRTPNDFGSQGEAPSHPELLEWLAARLIAEGWKLKPLHRLMVTSSTYRQGGISDPRLAKDADGSRLFARRLVRRLEAEAVRDALLAASGSLNRARGGPAVRPHIDPAAIMPAKFATWPKDAKDDATTWRRGIYVFAKRSVPYPAFQAFDEPDSNASRGERTATTIVPQALHLLNNPFAVEQVALLAKRVEREAGATVPAQVRLAHLLLFGRTPSDAEMKRCATFLAGWKSPAIPPLQALCHALVCSNEFLHVD